MENGTIGLIQTGSPSASNNRPTSVTMVDNNGPGGTGDPDGIPDVFNEATHFHVETKPNLSVGD